MEIVSSAFRSASGGKGRKVYVRCACGRLFVAPIDRPKLHICGRVWDPSTGEKQLGEPTADGAKGAGEDV